MGRANGDVDSFAGLNNYILAIKCDLRVPLHYHPVFGALSVPLITQPLTGKHFDSFHFETVALVENGESPPGPAVKPWRGLKILILR